MSVPLVNALEAAGLVQEPTPPCACGHDVQFYRTDEFLLHAVVDFLASGLRAGQPIVCIATLAHLKEIVAALRRRGLDTDEFLSGREAVWLDARETLASFMEGPRPNRELFMATVGRVFELVLRGRHYLVVRGYGEMVNLLANEGNIAGALELEALWNDLAATHPYSLLCSYSVENFAHEAGVQAARQVCGHHSRTLRFEQ